MRGARSVPFLSRATRSGRPRIEIEQSTQPWTSTDPASSTARRPAHDQGVPETLVIAFAMVVLDELCDRASEVALAHRNDPVETFFFDRPHKTFRVGVRIWCALGSQHDTNV